MGDRKRGGRDGKRKGFGLCGAQIVQVGIWSLDDLGLE